MVKLEPIEITPSPEGVEICVRGVVPLPKGPIPTPQEKREKFEAAIGQVKAALPELIPLLILRFAQERIESL
jgi:hypothetical protein